jgi:uncharacterized LabA/DUF88 family protein
MGLRRVGVFVDALNITMNGGFGLRYDALRRFAARDGAFINRMNVYLAVDKERAKEDPSYEEKTHRFCDVLRDFQFKVIEKPMRHYKDAENGTRISKAGVDIDMAVDILTLAPELDKILLCTSNGDFVSVVRAVQAKGVRVECLAFDNVSSALKKEVDSFISGYMIPGLLPVESAADWGTIGARVRGVCYDFSKGDGYGFMRFLTRVDDNLWVTDSRTADSPYKTVFAHVSQFEKDFDVNWLPSRDLIFEFTLSQNDRGMTAEHIELVSAP